MDTRRRTTTTTTTTTTTHNNNNQINDNDDKSIKIQVLLSRPYYRIGSTVVGTILITTTNRQFYEDVVQKNELEDQMVESEQQQQHHHIPIDSNHTRWKNCIYESLQFSIVGFCRYDPRWFNTSRIIHSNKHSIYPTTTTILSNDYPLPPHTIPFWSTSANSSENSNDKNEDDRSMMIELLQIPERTYGKWDDVNPMKPIQLPSRSTSTSSSHKHNHIHDEHNQQQQSSFVNVDREQQQGPELEQQQFVLYAYTFRVHIPTTTTTSTINENKNDNNNTETVISQQQQQQPHTFYGTSCRYYYQIVLRIQKQQQQPNINNNNNVTIEWIQHPLIILPPFDPIIQPSISVSQTQQQEHRYHPSKLSTTATMNNNNNNNIQIMAHSNGLPTRLSSIDMNEFQGQYTMNRYNTSLYHYNNINNHSLKQQQLYSNNNHIQSMCITDPITQSNIGILTIIGTPKQLYPGSRLSFILDLPIPQQYEDEVSKTTSSSTTPTSSTWIPCYQISACLQGQEMAITNTKNHDATTATTTTVGNNQRTVTISRRYIWDTVNERIDPYSTESISIHLVVPQENVPYSIITQSVEVHVQCVLDIVVSSSSSNNNTNKSNTIEYRTIHLEIPCHIQPPRYNWEQYSSTTREDHHPYIGNGGTNEVQYDNTEYDNDDRDGSSSQQFQSMVRKFYHSAQQFQLDNSYNNVNHESMNGHGEQHQQHNDDNNDDIIFNENHHRCNNNNNVVFKTEDIQTDLKLLSLQMAKICSYLPKPIGLQ